MAIITICAGVFCHGYINGFSVSKYDGIYSYGEADNWSSCDTSDLVTAFRYYCKSRNLAINGSVADAITSFTTTTFNNLCSKLGIDPTSLQAELKKTTQGNLGLRFLFSQTGITAYNRIFAEFLQNNDLSVGDTDINETVFNGKWFTDLDGNGCSVYIMPGQKDGSFSYKPIQYGTKYIYDGYDCKAIAGSNLTSSIDLYHSFTVHVINGLSENLGIYANGYIGSNNYEQFYIWDAKPGGNLNQSLYASYHANDLRYYGEMCLYMVQNGDTLYLGYVTEELSSGNYAWDYFNAKLYDPSNLEDADITINNYNNNPINNNTYNNNYTIIYNDGDTYNSDDDDEPLPTTPPDGGGGGGDDPGPNPGDPDNWNPTTPTIPTPTNPNFPTVNLPDIDIPNLPSLNFSLGDLRNKFPFSLPFDIIAILNVLDGEPKAPHIEATVPIGKWYTWEMDFDFSEFDNYARIFRTFEFIGFCIGLAVFTVHFVKG